jgi:hypothetical protein
LRSRNRRGTGACTAGRPCGRGGRDLLLAATAELVQRLQRQLDEVEHVSVHDRVREGLSSGLEPREQVTGHHGRVRRVLGEQLGRRRPAASLGDGDHQRGVQAHQRGHELPSTLREPPGDHHGLVDPHPRGTHRGELVGRRRNGAHCLWAQCDSGRGEDIRAGV